MQWVWAKCLYSLLLQSFAEILYFGLLRSFCSFSLSDSVSLSCFSSLELLSIRSRDSLCFAASWPCDWSAKLRCVQIVDCVRCREIWILLEVFQYNNRCYSAGFAELEQLRYNLARCDWVERNLEQGHATHIWIMPMVIVKVVKTTSLMSMLSLIWSLITMNTKSNGLPAMNCVFSEKRREMISAMFALK